MPLKENITKYAYKDIPVDKSIDKRQQGEDFY